MSTPHPTPPPCSTGKGDSPTPAYAGNTLTASAHDARSLLAPDDLMAVTATLAERQPDLTWVTAERLVVEALKFVATAARSTEELVPSALVDAGWHALIVNTEIYQGLCMRLGSFVHHYPAVAGAELPASGWQARTTAAIEQVGFTIDPGLWT
ncbi:hypothetical protein ACFYNM_23040 [Streptomyces spororaveus]|uniref:hypothetical protein n=1 Tax=Streptomyces spororaveus TaxID=284039 RepID=UPI00369CB9A0